METMENTFSANINLFKNGKSEHFCVYFKNRLVIGDSLSVSYLVAAKIKYLSYYRNKDELENYRNQIILRLLELGITTQNKAKVKEVQILPIMECGGVDMLIDMEVEPSVTDARVGDEIIYKGGSESGALSKGHTYIVKKEPKLIKLKTIAGIIKIQIINDVNRDVWHDCDLFILKDNPAS